MCSSDLLIDDLRAGRNIAECVTALLEAGVSGEYLFKKLSEPIRYKDEKKGSQTGAVQLEDDYMLEYAVQIPGSYKPNKPLPVLFVLHGGVTMPEPIPVGQLGSQVGGSVSGIVAKAKSDFILIVPQGSKRSPWWTRNGHTMVNEALKKVKRQYNVDTNRVFVTGFSDGGSGSYFHAGVDPTKFAATFPMNGMITNSEGGGMRVFVENYRNRPMFVCHTTDDHLYPGPIVAGVVDGLKEQGVDIAFHMFENMGHTMGYSDQIAPNMAQWLDTKVRDPWRDTVEWATLDPQTLGRCDWLVIGEIGSTEESEPFTATSLNGGGRTMFGHRGAGWVKVVKKDNEFTVEAKGAKQFRIGLRPGFIDPKQPIVVTVNGKKLFEGDFAFDAASVLSSFVRDEDPQTVVGSYLEIFVP